MTKEFKGGFWVTNQGEGAGNKVDVNVVCQFIIVVYLQLTVGLGACSVTGGVRRGNFIRPIGTGAEYRLKVQRDAGAGLSWVEQKLKLKNELLPGLDLACPYRMVRSGGRQPR